MNKLIVNHLGKHFVTSDTNTIVTELEVMHPAAKLIVMAAKSQARVAESEDDSQEHTKGLYALRRIGARIGGGGVELPLEEQESGDGTNFCVSFGGELLQRAEELLKEGIHANDVYKGYELARDKAPRFAESVSLKCVDNIS